MCYSMYQYVCNSLDQSIQSMWQVCTCMCVCVYDVQCYSMCTCVCRQCVSLDQLIQNVLQCCVAMTEHVPVSFVCVFVANVCAQSVFTDVTESCQILQIPKVTETMIFEHFRAFSAKTEPWEQVGCRIIVLPGPYSAPGDPVWSWTHMPNQCSNTCNRTWLFLKHTYAAKYICVY